MNMLDSCWQQRPSGSQQMCLFTSTKTANYFVPSYVVPEMNNHHQIIHLIESRPIYLTTLYNACPTTNCAICASAHLKT